MSGKCWCAILVVLFSATACKQKSLHNESEGSPDFRAGEYHDYYQRQDSAFYYYNRVVQNSADSIEKSTAHFKMGLWQLRAGDYYSAQESFLSSIKTLDEKNPDHFQNLAADYNSLANATLNLNDYPAATRNYYLALNFVPDTASRLHILNNIGVAYQNEKLFEKAILVFDTAIASGLADTSLKAKLITNLALTKWLAHPDYVAAPELHRGLQLRILINDSLGINSSFAHLSEYYTQKHPDSAYYYAIQRLEIARKLDDPNDRLEALNQLIKVSPQSETRQFSEQYLQLNDSLTNVHSRDRNQYALIRYDAEKSKADKLLLEKHITAQNLVIWGTVSIAVLITIVLSTLMRVRKRKSKEQAENAIRESRLKTSQKVHDVVANGLYRIMNELEHKADFEREAVIGKIEGLYEKSRDISYEDTDHIHDSASHHINELVGSFANDRTKVITVGNQSTFWSKVGESQKVQLIPVIEELLVNMQKHSKAKNVLLHFSQKEGVGSISYKDDGIGLSHDVRYGNGLNNTVNRIKVINGEFSFEKSREGGLTILINFPLESK